VVQSAATCSRWFFARGLFYPEDGGDTFLRNVGSTKIYTAPHLRRRHSSQSPPWKPQILCKILRKFILVANCHIIEEGYRGTAPLSRSTDETEVTGHLYTPTTQEAGWTPKLSWTWWRRRDILVHAVNQIPNIQPTASHFTDWTVQLDQCRLGQAVTLLTCVSEVTGSKPTQETIYLDWGLCSFLRCLQTHTRTLSQMSPWRLLRTPFPILIIH
jgi:hypothetical protein